MPKYFVDTVELPEEIASNLLDNLTKYKVILDAYVNVADSNDPVKAGAITDHLVAVSQDIEWIKKHITEEYIPDKYRSDAFIWEFNGTIRGDNKISIYSTIKPD